MYHRIKRVYVSPNNCHHDSVGNLMKIFLSKVELLFLWRTYLIIAFEAFYMQDEVMPYCCFHLFLKTFFKTLMLIKQIKLLSSSLTLQYEN